MSSLSIPAHTPSPSSSQYKSPCASPHTEDSNPPPPPTPNVYINGLPPHFSEDNLFALAAPFGTVRSVRSFTRFVGERSSGYGFVLFDTIEAAEKCIDALRRYRNLHPSFSKQIHKIPGTVYATSAGSPRTASDSGGACEGKGNATETFKAKMERLQDESSTNLYFEGLPLSIDDPTLAALVSPYAIKSSRFFQTKLSHPPRIIAFVRLETRAAAEEIIERLHGRMVRGWNDPGSRISVRFADTSEQRELRRSERTARDGDQSPARLTIAQAALLNLRGQELQPHPSLTAPPRTTPQHPVRLPATYPPLPVTTHPLTLPDYGHTFEGYTSGGAEYPLPSRSTRPAYQYSTMDPNMKVLFESLRRSGVPFAGHANEEFVGPGYVHQTARNGFTPAEELIFQAHAYPGASRGRGSMPQQQIPERIAQSVVGMSEDDFHSNAGYLGRGGQYGSHEEGGRRIGTMYNRHIHPAHVNARLAQAREVDGVALKQVQQEQHTVSYQNQQVQSREKQQQQQQQQHNQNNNQNQHNHMQHSQNHQKEHIQTQNQNQTHAHIRSTTVPHRSSTSSHVHLRHHQHNSMSNPSGANNNSNHNSNHNHNGHTQNDGQNNRDQVQYSNSISNSIFEHEHDSNNNIHTSTAGGNHDEKQHSNNKSNGTTYGRELHEYLAQGLKISQQKGNLHEEDTTVYDEVGLGSPPLVSPALTYSSRTPATMSPATPFFGSFEVKA